MQLVCNLNPGLSKLYIVVGVLLLAIAALGFILLPWLPILFLIVLGVALVLEGALHH